MTTQHVTPATVCEELWEGVIRAVWWFELEEVVKEGLMKRVALELGLQNSSVEKGSPRERDQCEPGLEDVTARGTSW